MTETGMRKESSVKLDLKLETLLSVIPGSRQDHPKHDGKTSRMKWFTLSISALSPHRKRMSRRFDAASHMNIYFSVYGAVRLPPHARLTSGSRPSRWWSRCLPSNRFLGFRDERRQNVPPFLWPRTVPHRGNNDNKKKIEKLGVQLQDPAPSFGPLLSPRPSSRCILGSRKWYRRASRWLNRRTETRRRLPVAALRLLFSCPPPDLPRARLTRWNRTGLQTTRAPVRGLALWLILCSFNKLSALGRVLVQSKAPFVSSARRSAMFGARRAATWG